MCCRWVSDRMTGGSSASSSSATCSARYAFPRGHARAGRRWGGLCLHRVVCATGAETVASRAGRAPQRADATVVRAARLREAAAPPQMANLDRIK